MDTSRTALELSEVTDEGKFERLATAILRESSDNYRPLVQTGVNSSGKTIKGPVDGLTIIQESGNTHIIAVHHTTTARIGLKRKWLYDPANPGTADADLNKNQAPGDIIKTWTQVQKWKSQLGDVKVTLILTTNQDPDSDVIVAATALAKRLDITLDIWSGSRLAHSLDDPQGQWIRASFLGIHQEHLSQHHLATLSRKSFEEYRRYDRSAESVDRDIDNQLMNIPLGVTFLVGDSGMGKTVACRRLFERHIDSGGRALFIPQSIVYTSMTLDAAIRQVVSQLDQNIIPASPSALALATPKNPLLLLVEDVNSTSASDQLIAKILAWSRKLPGKTNSVNDETQCTWKIVCPLWTRSLHLLAKHGEISPTSNILAIGPYSRDEGTKAVLARAMSTGDSVTVLQAEEIAASLGNDPLLIGLHQIKARPDPHRVIQAFVFESCAEAARSTKTLSELKFRNSLRSLGISSVRNGWGDLYINDIESESLISETDRSCLSILSTEGKLMRIDGSADKPSYAFRHDRIRFWVIADAIAHYDSIGSLDDSLIADPYHSERVAESYVWIRRHEPLLERILQINALSAFNILRLLADSGDTDCTRIASLVSGRLRDGRLKVPDNSHVKRAILNCLSDSSFPEVPHLVRLLGKPTQQGWLADFRNGELSGGIWLCVDCPPNYGAPWRDAYISHAKERFSTGYYDALSGILGQPKVSDKHLLGAIYLAGFFAEPTLIPALESAWISDNSRIDRISAYLWALARCGGGVMFASH